MEEFLNQDIKKKLEKHLAISNSIKLLTQLLRKPEVSESPALKEQVQETLQKGYSSLNESYADLSAILKSLNEKSKTQKEGFNLYDRK